MARSDTRDWAKARRERTRHLIELGAWCRRPGWLSWSTMTVPPCSERSWGWPIGFKRTNTKGAVRLISWHVGDGEGCGRSMPTVTPQQPRQHPIDRTKRPCENPGRSHKRRPMIQVASQPSDGNGGNVDRPAGLGLSRSRFNRPG
jgi:hypothetical protein